jgi:hypothetical protein
MPEGMAPFLVRLLRMTNPRKIGFEIGSIIAIHKLYGKKRLTP